LAVGRLQPGLVRSLVARNPKNVGDHWHYSMSPTLNPTPIRPGCQEYFGGTWADNLYGSRATLTAAANRLNGTTPASNPAVTPLSQPATLSIAREGIDDAKQSAC
jgi:hypothetical protein